MNENWTHVIETLQAFRTQICRDPWGGLPILADKLEDIGGPYGDEASKLLRWWLKGERTERHWLWYTRAIAKYGGLTKKTGLGSVLSSRVLSYYTEALFHEVVEETIFRTEPILKATIREMEWDCIYALRNGAFSNVADLTLDINNSVSVFSLGLVMAVESMETPHLRRLHCVASQNALHEGIKGNVCMALLKNKTIPKGVKFIWNNEA